jgi:glycosyltransferase involved in cell wall biosynthesis
VTTLLSDAAPAISILVCTRNRAATIGKCIESILANSVRALELLVIDQSDGDETQTIMLEIGDPRLHYLRTPTRGLARGRNIGIEASIAPIVLFTDDDCYVEPTWVESFLDEFRRDPALDAVYGRVMPYGDGGPGMICLTIMKATQPRLVEGLGWERVHEAIGHGNNMAFRRSCFFRFGLFLEWLGAGTPMTGGEDTDFSFRILRGGARIYYSPAPVAYHDNWMPIEAGNRQLYGYMVSASAVLTRFILRGSFAALRVQLIYFRNYYKDRKRWKKQNDPAGVRHVHRLVRRHLVGMCYGAFHLFRRPPKYAPGQRTLEWREFGDSSE